MGRRGKQRRKVRGRRAAAERLGLVGEERGRRLPSDRTILGRILGRFLRILLRLVATFVIGSVALVLIYRFIDPPMTPLMGIRVLEGLGEGRFVGVEKDWMPIEAIDPVLLRSVVAAEDARFFEHGGIDWQAVEEARVYNEKHAGEKVRGASTITMQCARNVFLWQGRNYLRKGLEAWFTYLMEFLWGKERILEVYLNVIEWGDGIYGVNRAALAYFDRPAGELSDRQAALLAAVLPNPRRWSPAAPTGWIEKRTSSIMKGARVVSLESLGEDYLK